MTEAVRPSQVKFLISAIFASEGVLIKARESLKKKFGPLDFQSPIMSFNNTGYYEDQMGANLKRQFLSFRGLIDPNELAASKLYTNRLEKRLTQASARAWRRINLDPGYISDAKLVLASCKNFFHRIYLNKGVYAEVTLHFRDKSFNSWPWTYPDYKSKDVIQIFNQLRKIYLRQLSK